MISNNFAGKNEISCLLDSDSDQDFQEKVEEKIKMRGRKSVAVADPAKQDQPKVWYQQILKAYPNLLHIRTPEKAMLTVKIRPYPYLA